MKRTGLGIALIIMSWLAGCVPPHSLHPIYTDQDVIFEPALLGEWVGADPKQICTFSKSKGKAYRLKYENKDGESGNFVVHLVEINETMFLDLFPEKPNLPDAGLYKYHLLPVHTFFLVEQIKPTLQTSFIELDWLKELLKKNPKAIQHEQINDMDDLIVLTASTRELQTFFVKHAKTEGAFGKPSEMTRKKLEVEKAETP